jgi:hypothetical protein
VVPLELPNINETFIGDGMFKPGDKVICTDNHSCYELVLLRQYEVEKTFKDDFCSQRLKLVGIDGEWRDTRFQSQDISAKKMTLPTDPTERKEYPILTGCVRYFPAALAGVSLISKRGNDKHNPGEELHHARSKSMDHGDCIMRHLIDTQDLLALLERGGDTNGTLILEEVNQLTWRVLAYSQQLHEKFGVPMAPGAKS